MAPMARAIMLFDQKLFLNRMVQPELEIKAGEMFQFTTDIIRATEKQTSHGLMRMGVRKHGSYRAHQRVKAKARNRRINAQRHA
jgi:hypothetical protein